VCFDSFLVFSKYSKRISSNFQRRYLGSALEFGYKLCNTLAVSEVMSYYTNATLAVGLIAQLGNNVTNSSLASADPRNGTSNLTDEEILQGLLGPRRNKVSTTIILTIIYCLIFVAGLVGNTCTCIVIIKNNYMHTATNYYLFSLAISDVLTIILGEYKFF
jgi:hypothetical protein